jgi:hypothetical protein
LKAFGVLTVVIWGWIAYVFKQNSMYNQNVWKRKQSVCDKIL